MSTGSSPRIVIIGAGPTGLGAAHRLQELSYDDWVLLEADDRVGGLAKSYVDDNGFTWDIGGHVMFSHYEYYDRLVQHMLGDQVLDRESAGVDMDGEPLYRLPIPDEHPWVEAADSV